MNFIHPDVYEPEDDSKLLLDCARELLLANQTSSSDVSSQNRRMLRVCEAGCGSGFVIGSLRAVYPEHEYYASDINKAARELTKKNMDGQVKMSSKSLLLGFKERFDLILFNAPYLPLEDGETLENVSMKDRAIYGGRYGYESVVELIEQLHERLTADGRVIVVFSSLSNKEHIEKIAQQYLFEVRLLASVRAFFEEMYALELRRTSVSQSLLGHGVTSLSYLAHGKHSIVLEGRYEKKPVIIKVGKEQHLDKEALYEEKLKDEPYVPKMFFQGPGYIVREKIEGTLIIDFFDKGEREDILTVLQNLLAVARRLDVLGINKDELINPYKHIFVQPDLSIMMIDYERCIFTPRPKNMTQILECIKRNSKLLLQKGIRVDAEKILEISQSYRQEPRDISVDEFVKI